MSQFKKLDIEQRILKAAKKVFIKKGFHQASLREITKEAKITLSNLYNYYPNKDALFVAVLKPELDDLKRLCEYGRQYQQRDQPFEPLDQKKQYLQLALDYIIKHKAELNLIFNQSAFSSLENYPDQLAREYETNMDLNFKAAQEQFPDRKITKPSSFFIQSMGHFHLMVIRKVVSEHYSREVLNKYVDELATFFWHGGMAMIVD